MENKEKLQRIGKLIRFFQNNLVVVLGLFLLANPLWANVEFRAGVDQNQIALDETISLQLTIQTSEGLNIIPTFSAPDFEQINSYNSVSIEHSYDSSQGGFVSRHSQRISKVLRPLKVGALKITKISAKIGDKTYHAPDILIQVKPIGTQPQQQQQESSNSEGPSTAQAEQRKQPIIFLRAELSRPEAFKGEQVIVSYYLYHLTKVFNVQVDEYPVLKGFLREDLDLPVLRPSRPSQSVNINGEIYQKSLLAQYAAYPLEKGKLKIDPMGLKLNYYSSNPDPFFEEFDPVFGMFQNLAPKQTRVSSPPVEIDVQPLPEEGRPEDYSGGVGKFTVVSAVNKYRLKRNEAVSLKVKVEGQGNTASIQTPQMQLPEGLELYDSQGRASSSESGVSEKVFEFLLIPRKEGEYTLPGVAFHFFDPIKKEYYKESTDPIQLYVTGVATEDAARSSPQSQPDTSPTQEKSEPTEPASGEIRYLKPFQGEGSQQVVQVASRVLSWGILIAFLILIALIGKDQWQRLLGRKTRLGLSSRDALDLEWNKLEKETSESSPDKSAFASEDSSKRYERLKRLILMEIEAMYSVEARALSLEVLGPVLVEEKGVSEEIWDQIQSFIEGLDQLRYSQSHFDEASRREEFQSWYRRARQLQSEIQVQAGLKSS